MAALIERLKEFDKDFRGKYLSFLEELQAKKPKDISLEFNTEPWDECDDEQIHYLSSKGIRQTGERIYRTPRHFVYESGISLEGLQKSLEGLQAEIDRHNIKVNWNKVLSLPVDLTDPKLIKKLTSDVEKYFRKNVYKGFKHFKLERTDGQNVFIKGMESEDIDEKDTKWEEGLAKIGEKYGVSLSLPINYYMK